MSIHNLRYNVQLIIIATRNKEIFEKFQDFSASNNYVRVIDTSAVMAFRPTYSSLHCDANAFFSAVTRSGQIEHV